MEIFYFYNKRFNSILRIESFPSFFPKTKVERITIDEKTDPPSLLFFDDSVVESWYRFAGRLVEPMETRKGRGGHDNDREARGEEDRMIQATEKGK